MKTPRGTRDLAASPAWVREYQAILEAYRAAGGDPGVFGSAQVAGLVVSANRVLTSREVPGVHLEAKPLPSGVRVQLRVDPGVDIPHPVHLCFGMLPEEGLQEIVADFDIGEGARVQFLSHCTFPNARHLRHVMEGRFRVGKAAFLRYSESHFHGLHGGIEVVPRITTTVDEAGRFVSEFNLVRGRVGRLRIDYDVAVAAGGTAELVAKVLASGTDRALIRERVRLNGSGARGLAKTRVAVKDRSESRVITTTEGNAPDVRGHMDCVEIVKGDAMAQNIPIVLVRDERAHVTHEASIGRVNQKELETLMARGLDEDEAVDVIIRGMLDGVKFVPRGLHPQG